MNKPIPAGSSAVELQKSQLRAKIREVISEVPPQEKEAASARLRARLREAEFWKNADLVLFYAPRPDELDIWPLLQEALDAGKRVFLPRYLAESGGYEACQLQHLPTDVVPGQYGIREGAPHCAKASLNRLDLTLVPGVAFDPHGRRLGRGKGFYDRLLSAVEGIKCGIAFDQQLVPDVPVQPHDMRLNCILTPTRCFLL